MHESGGGGALRLAVRVWVGWGGRAEWVLVEKGWYGRVCVVVLSEGRARGVKLTLVLSLTLTLLLTPTLRVMPDADANTNAITHSAPLLPAFVLNDLTMVAPQDPSPPHSCSHPV